MSSSADVERASQLASENTALWQQLHNVGAELIAARQQLAACDALRIENEALRAQLRNVGLEFLDARKRLQALQREREIMQSSEARAYLERRALVVLPRLLGLLPAASRITVLDAGARDLEHDPHWRPFPRDRLKLYCFEPDPAEAKRLNTHNFHDGIEREFYAAGIWGTSGRLEFEHNRDRSASSFLRLNRRVTDRWKFENPTRAVPARDSLFATGYEELPVVTLADWCTETNVRSVDFIKLHARGGELEILRGGGPLLASALGVLVEVAFVESYVGRPMFADIDRHLREQGFVFFDLLAHHYVGRETAPVAAQHLVAVEPVPRRQVSAWGQLIEGHALYMRDPIGGGSGTDLPHERVIRLAALAEAFGQIEYCLELVRWLEGQPGVKGTALAGELARIVAQASNEFARLSTRPEAVEG